MFMKIFGGLDPAFSIDPDPDIVIFNFIYQDVFSVRFLTKSSFYSGQNIFLSNHIWFLRIGYFGRFNKM